MNEQKVTHRKEEAGYTLVAIVVVCAFCLMLTASLLEFSGTSSSTTAITNSNIKNYYEVERTINKVASWMQANSKNIVGAFSSANFDTNFDVGAPTVGTNQGSQFQVPTLIKMKSSTNAVQLTNNAFFGTSAFPTTNNIDTNAAFNAVSAFSAANFGQVSIRIIAVWARSTDGHYEPVFRIDAITGSDPQRGVHGINFIRTDLVTSTVGFGYFASNGDFVANTPNNECRSYQWAWNAGTSTWTRGASRANCIIMGSDDLTFSAKIWGHAYTQKSAGIHFTHSGAVSGTQCMDLSCHPYTLPTQVPWATNCNASNQGDINAAATTTINAGPTMASRCWRDVNIGSNRNLIIAAANTPYYFRNLSLHNNGRITFPTVGPGQKYILNVETIDGSKINGNQLVATNLAPHQLELNITGNINLTLNGTASIHAVVNCGAGSTVNLSGNFSFFGAIRCNGISAIGNAIFNYDEALGTGGALSDMKFSLYKASQRYR